MRIKYEGPWDKRDLWGVTWAKGETIDIDDPALAEKALRLDGFVKARGRPKKVEADGKDERGHQD